MWEVSEHSFEDAMVQLADQKTRADVDTNAQTNTQTENTESKLGYELLYENRRPGRLRLPMSMPDPEEQKRSTGSALLDSFERDRAQASLPLQSLRLVPITPTAPTPHPELLVKPLVSDVKESAIPAQPKKSADHSTDSAAHSAPSSPDAPTADATVPPVTEPVLPTVQPASGSQLTSTTQRAASQTKAHPQLEAAPARARPPQPAPVRNLPPPPARVAIAAGQSDSKVRGAIVNLGKAARDSAAAVGLLDLNDTLLFGGDHEDLSCVDPFLGHSQDDDAVLGYLSQQISSFTVSRLAHNTPITTNLKVLNRPDDPKRETVLGINAFKLSGLTPDSDKETADELSGELAAADGSATDEPVANKLSSQPVELADLSQQVSALNRKIEYLSKKLEEATGQ